MEISLNISQRVHSITTSPTVTIAAKAILLRRQKVDVIDLSVGEPDFPTPGHIKEAAKKAIDANLTKYTLNSGILELREAIAQKLKNDYHIEYDTDEIIVSNGAKQCIINVILSLINRGDEVIIPAPYWVSYPQMVKLAEGQPKIIQTREENGFRLTAQDLKENVSTKTKAIILCNPSNPTGSIYSKEELENLSEIIESRQLFLIADEIYSKLTYDNITFVSSAAVNEIMRRRTIIVHGVSKAYAMTGWRIGYAAGDRTIIEAANKIQSHSTSNASSISQYATLEALTGPQDEIIKMRIEFERRRDYVFNRLTMMQGITCYKPSGAFYVFPNISSFFGKHYRDYAINNSSELAEFILQEVKVAFVPGSAFGDDHHIRISYATSMNNLERGMDRIEEALGRLD